jgi:hypothetical protein
MKLSVLLAKKQHAQAIFKKLVTDYLQYFSNTKNSPFKGWRKEYRPYNEAPVNPQYVGNQRVVTTVNKKLEYFEKTAAGYINNFLSVEATNATAARAELKVGDINFGTLSTMELLSLRSFIEAGEFVKMYENLPVRPETYTWERTNDEEYKESPDIYAIEPLEGVDKTSENLEYILEDPNVRFLTDTAKYQPQKTTRRTDIKLGDWKLTHFSGEVSFEERAAILERRSKLYEAVIVALEEANKVETVESQCTAQKIFDYLHKGK